MPQSGPMRVDLTPYEPLVEAAARLGIPPGTLTRWCRQEADQAARQYRTPWAVKERPPNGCGKAQWWVHKHFRGTPDLQPPQQRVSTISDRYPRHLVDGALTKLAWIRKWRALIAREPTARHTELAERIVEEAKREGPGFRISVASLFLWRKKYKQHDLEGLVNQYRRGEKAEPNRSPEAIDYFYMLYRVPSGPTVKLCHTMTRRKAKDMGWRWPESYAATGTWLRKHDDLSPTYLMRNGFERWAHRYLPHHTIDYTGLEPGEAYVSDHKQCDFWVRCAGKTVRPWLTSVMDMRSRCIVGWHLGARPHQDAILSALLMAFRDWAIPQRLKIDNGKDFDSKLVTGMTKVERRELRRQRDPNIETIHREKDRVTCDDPKWAGIVGELGIKLSVALPYSPWSKGIQERFFRTFGEQCSQGFASYCGSSPQDRPEYMRKHGVPDQDVPDIEDARRIIADWLTVYHADRHQFQGRTEVPIEVWRTASRIRRAEEKDLLYVMQSRGVYRVTANGVRFKVGAGVHAYGRSSVALRRWVGRKLFVTIDPNDLSRCAAWTPVEGRREFIAWLDSNEHLPPFATTDQEREAIAEMRRRQARAKKAASEAPLLRRIVAQEIRAAHGARAAELRKTGTDGAARANIVPVSAGFDTASMPVQRAVERSSSMDGFNDLTWAEKMAALGYRPIWPGREEEEDLGDPLDALKSDRTIEADDDKEIDLLGPENLSPPGDGDDDKDDDDRDDDWIFGSSPPADETDDDLSDLLLDDPIKDDSDDEEGD